MKKTLSLLAMTLGMTSLLVLSACNNGPEQMVHKANGTNNGQGGGGGQKPINDVAPHYRESQFKKGQWIEWQMVSLQTIQKSQCMRWELKDISAQGYLWEATTSIDCTTWDRKQVETFFFSPLDRKITTDRIVNEGQPGYRDGDLLGKSIDDWIFGNEGKVNFTNGKYVSPVGELPAFRLNQHSQWFLNQDSSPFHAFAMHWEEVRSAVTWRVDYVTSSPAISISQP